MRNLLKDKNYVPFGSQYYRAPSPHKEDWDRDLKRMSELGFNTVKYWIQWRWNNPEKGEYYFDDIDELMNLAQKYNLKVMLNTIFDVAPAWIYKEYSDASMVTLSGRKIGPQSQPHRQIGGLGYCFNHDGVMGHFYEFLKVAIERYKDHPALEIWNVGSEPELTSSMAEMRDYANDLNKMGDMLCFCDNCKTKFRKWLSSKYESLEELNRAWNRNYKSFYDAEIPITRNTFNDIIDWRMFFVYTLGENVKKRFEVAEEIDRGKHPLMCHHVFIQGFPVTSTANDPWNVGQYGDLHGFTQMDDAAMIDILRSCARGKPVISAEMLMLPGYTLDLPKLITADDIKKFVFSGVAGNQKGFIFWQYKPEILGREAPTWGLSFLDGHDTSHLESYAEVGKVLQNNVDLVMDGQPEKAEAAIMYNPENQVFAWASTGKENSATDSILGIHKALYERNITCDFLHPKDFKKGELDNYKVLVIPFPYLIDEMIAKQIKDWVNKGGVLISESYTAGWNKEGGHHEKIVPGYGLHEVFGLKQKEVEPSDENNEVEIELTVDLSFIKKGTKVTGSFVKETFELNTAEPLAQFNDGRPAITINSFGDGKAIQIGSYTGMIYHTKGLDENGRLFPSLVEYAIKLNKPKIDDDIRVRVDTLKDGKTLMLILQNKEDREVSSKVTFKNDKAVELTEQFTGEKIKLNQNENDISCEFKLKAKEVKVYCG
ncbi:MAG: beta-galactosidase [Melioribacteraceae bacterium]|nr:beta-galactosidase [Melioribacteraceae bacterium]MCF8412357.1 beta-galactosidase [Melioribacteraceae bacterium]